MFESYAALRRTAKIHTHLTSLAARFAGERLTALAQAEGVIGKDVPEVLFVCVHNSGRSQMAAALLAHHGSRTRARALRRVRARCDASPRRRRGDGRDRARSQCRISQAADRRCGRSRRCRDHHGLRDACAVYPGKRYLDWSLPDPQDESLDTVRVIRDDIDARVRALLTELDTVPA